MKILILKLQKIWTLFILLTLSTGVAATDTVKVPVHFAPLLVAYLSDALDVAESDVEKMMGLYISSLNKGQSDKSWATWTMKVDRKSVGFQWMVAF